MKIKHYSFLLLAIIAGLTIGYFSVFTVPKTPELISINQSDIQTDWYCRQPSNITSEPIDKNGEFNLVVWNIHKQGDAGWQSTLEDYGKNTQLLMLQEATLTESFQKWLASQEWVANQVNAFKVFGESAGVLNLSSVLPNRACAYTAVEPWILLPKSALYARYRLSNGQELVTINLHAINFTLGTEDFQTQINHLERAVKKHEGPMIIAGDFNTWSEGRWQEVRYIMAKLFMQEVTFKPDHRRRFINDLAFDHVFYRDLNVLEASSLVTTASDHNPMMVKFSL
ncbi:endonuclease/exonuclease/phosphatase family protein [Vibrio rumoiensis]|uniref:Endonuclease/exonuclease/phosphatase domain-containing protein n=1 Tax=Vibrio rumoiensis 1S-45 TaxID=1188252 RepID=A0A1E5E124_9VIBR|nr:endonuclease/exonuclease/phosphatase family protein [Vibrio rumoiensis]OEF23958.1 hypothetical protein A1QC_02070 [Vibrio rumoiensis 1S-45]